LHAHALYEFDHPGTLAVRPHVLAAELQEE
jgi:hypothetical protein